MAAGKLLLLHTLAKTMTDNDRHSKLGEEDLKRVEEFLSIPVNRVERKPFRPLWLLFWLWVVVAGLGLVSVLLGRIEGLV